MSEVEEKQKDTDDSEIRSMATDVLDRLGESLASTRSDAIQWRASCGIEQQWLEDEEFYDGLDDANRHEHGGRMRGKPFTAPDPQEGRPRGSNVFFNITRPYVDNFSSRIGDMIMPTDGDKGWSLSATPVPEMVEFANGRMPDHVAKQIHTEVLAKNPGMAPEQLKQIIDKTADDAIAAENEKLKKARKMAEKAEKRIMDWHVECQFHSHNRRVIDDAAKVGTGVLKGPFPVIRRQVAFREGKVIVEDVLRPASIRVDYWNCFPDPECGDNIHNGSSFWERDDITEKRVRLLLRDDKYLRDQILAVLLEGPHQATKEFVKPDDGQLRGLKSRERSKTYEIWYYYGTPNKEELEAVGLEAEDDEQVYDVQLEMVNNHVIKASINHLGTGEFPYDFMVCQQVPGSPFGKGVARQMRTPQRVVNSAGRNMMNNAGLAGGPMMVFARGYITPADGSQDYSIEPLKVWEMGELATSIDDVKKAISFIDMPMFQVELERIINLGLQLAEDVTGMPMLMQGQQGSAPETVGGMQLLNNNASSPLRRIAKIYDDLITEPHITRYYRYLLQWGEDDEKGDFQVDARGSSALVERDLASQDLAMLGQLVPNPVYGKDPTKWMDEFMKSKRLDPRRLDYDDEEWKKIVEGLAQQAQKGDSSIEVAQVRAQSAEKIAQANIEMETAMATIKEKNDQQAQEREDAYKSLDLEIKRLGLALDAGVAADANQTAIATTLAKIKGQIALALGQAPSPQIATPAVEPPGRAPNGKAFQA
ncbi:MAG: hypothetical protein E4H01_00700 [Lysobacterales bacterium]|nr:MAG: hypothetical protein E4H01_00700 [Xanthomonadales bacterium]